MPALSAAAIIQETTMLKRRYDDITSECQATRKKLELALERSNGFISTSDLDVDKDDLAKEVAALENEMEEVEYGIEVANHEKKTYELMIERIRAEEKTYKRDLGTIDHHQTAKQMDAEKLQLIVKDATDVRDGARGGVALRRGARLGARRD